MGLYARDYGSNFLFIGEPYTVTYIIMLKFFKPFKMLKNFVMLKF